MLDVRKALFTQVWDVATFESVHKIDNLNHWVRALVIKKNKLYAGIYQAIKIWDVATFETERIIDIKGLLQIVYHYKHFMIHFIMKSK